MSAANHVVASAFAIALASSAPGWCADSDSQWATAIPRLGTIGTYLLAFSDADDEDAGLLGPPPSPDQKDASPRWQYGARAGLFLPVASRGSWNPSFSVGAFTQRPLAKSRVLEIALDYTKIGVSEGESSSQLLFTRGEVLFPLGETRGRIGAYWLAGGQFVSEWAEDTQFDSDASASGVSIDVGAGLRPPAGTWDVRAAFTFIVGSDKGSGALSIAAGGCF